MEHVQELLQAYLSHPEILTRPDAGFMIVFYWTIKKVLNYILIFKGLYVVQTIFESTLTTTFAQMPAWLQPIASSRKENL